MSAPTMPDVITAAVEFAEASRAFTVAEAAGMVPDTAVKRCRYARRNLDAARQLIPCPTCGTQLASLLAQCEEPACLSAAIAEDHDMNRLEDQ